MAETYKYPTTTEVLMERMRSNSKPAERTDPWNVHLAVQGAGRAGGIVLFEMTRALRDMGGVLRKGYNGLDAFDGFDGASSSAYVVATAATERGDGELEKGISVLYEDLDDSRFFSRRRIPNSLMRRGTPAIDLSYMEEIMTDVKPLRWERLGEDGRPVTAYVTSAVDGRAKPFNLSTMDDRDKVIRTIRVSGTYPIFAGMPLKDIDGEMGLDGGISVVGPPVQQVQENSNATHILAIMRETSWMKTGWSPSVSVGAKLIEKDFPVVADQIRTLRSRYAENIKFIDDAELDPPDEPTTLDPYIETLRIPAVPHKILPLDADPKLLTVPTMKAAWTVKSRFNREEYYPLPSKNLYQYDAKKNRRK